MLFRVVVENRGAKIFESVPKSGGIRSVLVRERQGNIVVLLVVDLLESDLADEIRPRNCAKVAGEHRIFYR